MALQVRELTIAAPAVDNSLAAPNDSFNIIPTANAVYDVYVAPVAKAAVVKAIRLVNISGAPVKINIYFMRPNASGQYRRRQISPVDMLLQPGYVYIDDDDLTLEPSDRIQAKADTANAIQYVISGVERDI